MTRCPRLEQLGAWRVQPVSLLRSSKSPTLQHSWAQMASTGEQKDLDLGRGDISTFPPNQWVEAPAKHQVSAKHGSWDPPTRPKRHQTPFVWEQGIVNLNGFTWLACKNHLPSHLLPVSDAMAAFPSSICPHLLHGGLNLSKGGKEMGVSKVRAPPSGPLHVSCTLNHPTTGSPFHRPLV